MKLVAFGVVFAAVSAPALAQQLVPTCVGSVPSYRTHLAQRFKLDTMLQVDAEEAATFFVISEVLTLAEDNDGVRCQGTLTVRKEIEHALKSRPANKNADPLETSYSFLMMMMKAGSLAPVRWEIIRSDDGGRRISDLTSQ